MIPSGLPKGTKVRVVSNKKYKDIAAMNKCLGAEAEIYKPVGSNAHYLLFEDAGIRQLIEHDCGGVTAPDAQYYWNNEDLELI